MVPEMHMYNTSISPISIGMKSKNILEMVTEKPMKALLRAIGKMIGVEGLHKWLGIVKSII